MSRRWWLRVGGGAFVVAALVFFGLALVDTWDEIGGELPPLTPLVTTGVLWAAGLLVASQGWVVLLGHHDRRRHSAAFLVAQFGKYLPGGIGQAAGQVGLARASGVAVHRGVVAMTLLALTQAAAGVASAVVLALVWTDPSTGLRVLLAVAAVAGTAALLEKRWMVWLLGRIPRTAGHLDEVAPRSRQLLGAWAANLVALAATTTGYALVLGSLVEVERPVLVAAAHAAAWTAGFLAVPIPSGLGVREVVLLAILGGDYSASVLVAASAIHRIASMLAEAVLAAVAAAVLRPGSASGPVSSSTPAERGS